MASSGLQKMLTFIIKLVLFGKMLIFTILPMWCMCIYEVELCNAVIMTSMVVGRCYIYFCGRCYCQFGNNIILLDGCSICNMAARFSHYLVMRHNMSQWYTICHKKNNTISKLAITSATKIDITSAYNHAGHYYSIAWFNFINTHTPHW